MGLWVFGFYQAYIYIYHTQETHTDASYDTDNCNRGTIPISYFFFPHLLTVFAAADAV